MVKKGQFFSVFLILCLTITLPIIRAEPEKPKIYIDPQNNAFSTETTTVGTNFTVSIKAADWASPGIFSYELKLSYNNTLLEAVAAEIPADHWLKPSKPTNIFLVDPGTLNQTLSYVSFAVTLLGVEEGKTGGGTIATVTFKITKAPTAGNFSCTLELRKQDIIMVDANTVEVPQDQYDIVNGNYIYSGPTPPPAAKPTVYIDPKDNNFFTSTTSVGDSFNVSIKAANWSAPGVFGYKFKLAYNNTLLEATSAIIPDGHWLTPVNAANISKFDPGTINQTEGFVSFNVTLLSPEQGKVGNGTIATVTFNITKTPSTGNVSCPLEIKDIILVDPDNKQIPSDQYNVIKGNYTFSAAGPPTAKADLNNDGKVNIEDVAVWGLAFGSHSGHPRWNPIADMNGDGKVDMIDAVLIAKAWTS